MNWQNVPRFDKTIKRAVLSKRGALVFADYEQIEPKLTAYFAAKIGHPEFAERINSGEDSYTAVAQLVTGKEEITEVERQTWKKTFLALVYGGGVPAIQRYFPGMQYPEAKQMISTFHSAWPAVRALQNEVAMVHQDRGFIVTPWGRQLHAEPNGEHKLLNKLIQGSAADLMKQAILEVNNGLTNFDQYATQSLRAAALQIELEQRLRDDPVFQARMVSVVHDELILDAPPDEVPALAAMLPEWMAEPARPRITDVVPVTVDVEVSTESWADKIGYDEWKEARAAVAA